MILLDAVPSVEQAPSFLGETWGFWFQTFSYGGYCLLYPK